MAVRASFIEAPVMQNPGNGLPSKVSEWDLGPPLGGIYGIDDPRPLQRTVNVVVNDDTLDVAVTPNQAWIEKYPGFKYVMLSAIKVEELE